MNAFNRIFLIGMPGSGKSTIGRALAKPLSLNFIDADQTLIQRTGVAISTIFDIEGEAGFREREATLINELTSCPGILLATGGGAILREQTRHNLKQNGLVIYLRASVESLVERTRRDTQRPLLQGKPPEQALAALLAIRDPLYTETAHLIVDTKRQSVSKLVHHIIGALKETAYWDSSPITPEK